MNIIEDAKTKLESLANLKEINFVGNYINYSTWNNELIDDRILGQLIVI